MIISNYDKITNSSYSSKNKFTYTGNNISNRNNPAIKSQFKKRVLEKCCSNDLTSTISDTNNRSIIKNKYNKSRFGVLSLKELVHYVDYNIITQQDADDLVAGKINVQDIKNIIKNNINFAEELPPNTAYINNTLIHLLYIYRSNTIFFVDDIITFN